MEDLFGHVPEKPRARRTDPWTSHAAAEKAVEFVGTHKARIAAYLESIYPRTATPDQIGKRTRLRMEQVDRVRAAMVREGTVEIVGAEKMANGNHAGLWRWVKP